MIAAHRSRRRIPYHEQSDPSRRLWASGAAPPSPRSSKRTTMSKLSPAVTSTPSAWRPSAAASLQARTYQSYAELLRQDFDVLIVASYCPDHGPDAVAASECRQARLFRSHRVSHARRRRRPRRGRRASAGGSTCWPRTTASCVKPRRCSASLNLASSARCSTPNANMSTTSAISCCATPTVPITGAPGCPPSITIPTPSARSCRSRGVRPVSVIGQAVAGQIPGSPNPQDFCASFVRLDNGGLVRVLLSFSAVREPSSVWYALYGTKGMAESDRWQTSWGASDLHVYQENDPVAEFARTYRPRFPAEHRQATRAGHGGGDYFAVHHFLTALRSGTPPPIDVYRACDFTLPGILAYRSAMDNGASLTVPDFRNS